MAWIKMRTDLREEPEVIQLAERLDLEDDTVVGKLHKLWGWADGHTSDGRAPGITKVWVDRYLGKQGWGEAMEKVGWLIFSIEGIEFPNFDRHMGASAKLRAENTLRQRLSRKQRDEGATGDSRGVIPRPFQSYVRKRDGDKCAYCEKQAAWKHPMTLDHILPVSRGGKTAVDNLLSCCQQCNNEKNDRTPLEWLGEEKVKIIVARVSHEVRDKFVTEPLPDKRRGEEIRVLGGVPPITLPAQPPELIVIANPTSAQRVATSFLPTELDTPEFRTAWQEWQRHRGEIRKPLKPTQVTHQLRDFCALGVDKSIAQIRQSIRNGWQGLFEEKGTFNGNGTGNNRGGNGQADATARRIAERSREYHDPATDVA